MHTLKRVYEDPDCEFASFPLDGGNTYCTVYIAVECADEDPLCAYEISLRLHEYTDIAAYTGDEITNYPPKYLPADVDYVDGIIGYKESHYYYLPYEDEMGDVAVMLNKTNPLGESGLMALAMNIQKDGSAHYSRWSYPTHTRSSVKSSTGDP